MDQNLPATQNQPNQQLSQGPNFILWILIVGSITIWLVFWLNLFGLINLNRYLTFLPTIKPASQEQGQKITSIKTPTPSPTPKPAPQKLTLPCPLLSEFCAKVEIVSSLPQPPPQVTISALVFGNVPAQTSILAVTNAPYNIIEGQNDDFEKEAFRKVVLKYTESLRIKYVFSGSLLLKEGNVARGETIGLVGQKLRGKQAFGKQYNLIVLFMDSQNKYIGVQKARFENGKIEVLLE